MINNIIDSQIVKLLLAIISFFTVFDIIYTKYYFVEYGELTISYKQTIDNSDNIKYEISIINSGKTVIKKSDFDSGDAFYLKFIGLNNIKIYNIKSNRAALIDKIYKYNNNISLINCTINPEEYISFYILAEITSKKDLNIAVNGVVSGVQIICIDDCNRPKKAIDYMLIILYFISFVLLIIISIIICSIFIRTVAKKKIINITHKYINIYENDEFLKYVFNTYKLKLPRGYHYIKYICSALNASKNINNECNDNSVYNNLIRIDENFPLKEGETNSIQISYWYNIIRYFYSQIREYHATLGTD